MEYGIVIPKGISYVRKEIPCILEDATNELTFMFRELLNTLYDYFILQYGVDHIWSCGTPGTFA